MGDTRRLSKTGGVGLRDSPCSRTSCTLRGAHHSSACPVFEILRVEMKKLLFAGLVGGLIAICFCWAGFLLTSPSRLSLATVDLQGLLKGEAHRVSRLGLSGQKEQEALEESMEKLRHILRELSSSGIILEASAVVSGNLPDHTALVRQKLEKPR
jgi:hypothetical protein